MNENSIEEINFLLSTESGSFMHLLHEGNFFDEKLFQQLLNCVKTLQEEKDLLSLMKIKYDNCVGFSFIANLLNRLNLLSNIECDLRNHPNYTLNISFDKYHGYREILNFEIESLFYMIKK